MIVTGATVVCLLLLVRVTEVKADYVFEVQVDSLQNPTGRCLECQETPSAPAGCCDDFRDFDCPSFAPDLCDTYFIFCLREFGTSGDDTFCPLGRQETPGTITDMGTGLMTFQLGTDALIGLPNPLSFSVPGDWPGRVQLLLVVMDRDPPFAGFGNNDADDVVARYFIQENLAIETEFTAPELFESMFADISLRFRVTCADGFNGPNCEIVLPITPSPPGSIATQIIAATTPFNMPPEGPANTMIPPSGNTGSSPSLSAPVPATSVIAILGAVGGLVATLSILVLIVVIIVCVKRKQSTAHHNIFEMTGNEAYIIANRAKEVTIPTSQNEAYGTAAHSIIAVSENETYSTVNDLRDEVSTSQNEAYGTAAHNTIALSENEAYSTVNELRDEVTTSQNEAYGTAAHNTIAVSENEAYSTVNELRDEVTTSQNEAYGTAAHNTIAVSENEAYSAANELRDEVTTSQNEAYGTVAHNTIAVSENEAYSAVNELRDEVTTSRNEAYGDQAPHEYDYLVVH